jgi:hypothetical protein
MFDRRAGDQRVLPGRTTHGDFAEHCAVAVALLVLAELMVVTLIRQRTTGGHKIFAVDQRLTDEAAVDAARAHRLPVGCA